MRKHPAYNLAHILPPMLHSVFLSVPLALLAAFLALCCQPADPGDTLALFWEKPIRILLNVLPVWLLILCAASAFANLFYGAAAAALPLCLLSIANRMKIQIRDEPVFPRDLALWKEAGGAIGAYEIPFPRGLFAVVLLFTLILILLGRFTGAGRRADTGGNVPPRRRRKARKHWKIRLAGSAACLGILALLTLTLFASDDLYNDLGASSPYRLSVVFNENGFLYNFFHQFTTYQVDRPAGYSRARAAAWDASPLADGRSGGGNTGRPVHVICVMNEAFSDITDDPAFAFSDETDPLPALHALRSDPHALSLRLVVPGFAGGTANTEFDVFTGMQTNALGAGTASAMRTVNRNLDSLFRLFRSNGYRTSFFHPGDRWFYNRENVYRWFGAEETLFIEQMHGPDYPEPEYKGRWVTDDYLAGLIEGEFLRAVRDGRLLFHAMTTIQNHMGYPYSKYGDGYEYPPVILAADTGGSAAEGTLSGVDAETRETLEVYVEGARDADAMLGRLRDFFAGQTEPVVLMFYGDHLPYLGENRHCYAALNMDAAKEDGERENRFAVYETPCVIWANGAAADLLDWDTAINALNLPENGRLSAAFLGAALLELTGRGQETAWIAFLNDLRRRVPVVQGDIWMLPDGRAVYAESGLPADKAAARMMEGGGLQAEKPMDANTVNAQIRKWRQWTYYKLQEKKIQ